jgi:hypothetical protein
MFKKKPKPIEPAELSARLTAAEARLQSLRVEAIDAATSDPDKLPALSESAARLEFEINALTEALRRAEVERAAAEERDRLEADRLQRQQTARDLRTLADALELAVAPLPDVLEGLRVAIDAILPIVGPNGLPDLLRNLGAEIPSAVELFAAEIRARADAVLQGRAPATLPAPFVPSVVREEEPPLPEITVFVLQPRVTWPVDAHGRRQSLGPFQIGGVPEFWADIALKRGLAILPTDSRYATMRAEAAKTGWPHVPDPMAVRDLDRDPNTVQVFSSGGRKLRDEPTSFENYRKYEPPREAEIDVMLPP